MARGEQPSSARGPQTTASTMGYESARGPTAAHAQAHSLAATTPSGSETISEEKSPPSSPRSSLMVALSLSRRSAWSAITENTPATSSMSHSASSMGLPASTASRAARRGLSRATSSAARRSTAARRAPVDAGHIPLPLPNATRAAATHAASAALPAGTDPACAPSLGSSTGSRAAHGRHAPPTHSRVPARRRAGTFRRSRHLPGGGFGALPQPARGRGRLLRAARTQWRRPPRAPALPRWLVAAAPRLRFPRFWGCQIRWMAPLM